MPDSRKKQIELKLDGKLMTGDPVAIGTNFRTLDNMRYTDTHPKGIGGNTKINTAVLETYLKTRNAFHFKKVQPAESHIICQEYNTGLTASVIKDNRSVIPAAGNFYELMTLDVAPATAWPIGATITGGTSTKTCTVVAFLTTLTYIVTGRSGTYTLGEILSDGTTTADQGAANPTFADYTLWTDSTGAGRGYFSNAPDGQMIYANGVDNCIWGGDEIKVGAFITSTAVVADDGVATSPKDYTEKMQNTKTDSDNIVTIGGGNDSYCVLLLHGDEADGTGGVDGIQDSSASNHTITAVNGAVTDDAQAHFGLGSIYFDGTNDYLTVPDHANWYFGADPFTIDFWANRPYETAARGICGQYVDADNYWYLTEEPYYNISGTRYHYIFKVVSGGTTKANYTFNTINGAYGWRHIELVRNATNVYLFHNGVSATLMVGTAISTNEVPNLAAVLEVGASSNHATVYNGWLDEFRISKGIARHTANFSVPSQPYAAEGFYYLVGSPRPLQGIKHYVESGNQIASVLTGKVWNGTTWDTLTLTDYTDTGAALATTGSVKFGSTVSNAKPKYIGGYFLYWYQFYLDAGQSTLYQITLDAPFQNLIDLWDGVYRDVATFYKKATVYFDATLNVLKTDYEVATPDTYVNLSSLGAFSAGNNCLEIGFTERMCGLTFTLPPDYVNTTANTTMAVDYWNGAEYVSVGEVSDGTASGGISFAISGIVTWNNTNLQDEVKSDKLLQAKTTSEWYGEISTGGRTETEPLYAYRVRFDEAMDASVRLDYVGGITAQRAIKGYKFAIFAQGRILLCCDTSEQKNKVTCSSKWMPQVYNGADTVDIFLGDESELNCGVELFSQYGGNLYSLILAFKDTEAWVMAGQDITQWAANSFPISTSIGCPAPQTLQTINLAAEPGQGINRSLAIWQGANGIYMSDGRAPIPIHGDIKEYFDRSDSTCIKASLVGDSVGFIDNDKQEYHWLFASGTATTTLNKELVYDIRRNKWFEIDRGTGMYLQCGVSVQDTYGNQYAYGFLDTGYMERLENGTTFDGNSIVQTMQFGDFAPLGLGMEVTQLDHFKLVMVGKTTTTSDVTCTHYGDSNPTGTDHTLDPTPTTNYRVAITYFDDKLQAFFHTLKFTITTTDETCGFEPLSAIGTFHPLQEQ